MASPDAATSTRRSLQLVPFLLQDATAQLLAEARNNLLTLLGIAWGAASLILLLSLGSAFHAFLEAGVDVAGDLWTQVDGDYTVSDSGGARPGRPVELTTEDLDWVTQSVGSAAAVAGEVLTTAVVETPHLTRATVVSAASSDLAAIQNHRIAQGRWFTEDDERSGFKAAVVGASLVEPFFDAATPLGQTIQVEGVPFQVIGVLERKGFQLITDRDVHDNMLFVPLAVGQRALGRGNSLDHLLLAAITREEETLLATQVRAALGQRHHLAADEPRGIVLHSVSSTLGPIRKIAVGLTLLLGFVGTISLSISGLAVASLMMAVVADRRMEFAMRRVCGARRSQVLLQLVVETLVVVIGGGLLGVLGGIAGVGILNLVPLPEAFPPPQLVPSVVVTTFFTLVVVGMGASVLPARAAMKIAPNLLLRIAK